MGLDITISFDVESLELVTQAMRFGNVSATRMSSAFP